jgi:hypothetical protein
LPVAGSWGRHPDRTDRPGRVDEGCTGGGSPASLSGPSQGTTRRPTARSPTAHARKGSSGERCRTRGLVADRRLVQPPCTPDGHVDQLEVARTPQERVGGASLTVSTTLSHPGWRPAAAASWSDGAPHPPAGQIGDAASRFPATARRRRYGRHGLAEGPAGPGRTAPSPDEHGGGVAPAQPRPVAAPASRHRHRHRRALLGRCRPSSSP